VGVAWAAAELPADRVRVARRTALVSAVLVGVPSAVSGIKCAK